MKRLATRARSRRCGFEILERRTQMASLILEAQAWTNPNNDRTPDNLIPADPMTPLTFTVTLGDNFFLQLTARDSRPDGQVRAGVVALGVGTQWNIGTANINFTGTTMTGNRDVNDALLVTTRFPFSRVAIVTGNTASTNGTSVPNDLSAGGNPIDDATCNPNPSAYATTQCREFSLYQFRAVALGTSRFVANLNNRMAFADSARLDLVNGQTPNDPADDLEVIINVVDGPRRNNGSISGYVFADANFNGARDRDPAGQPLEIGLPNVTLTLSEVGDAVTPVTVTTGPDGWYEFSSLPPGIYSVVETQPAGFISTASSLGTILPGGITSGLAFENEFRDIVLNAGEHAVDYDFGEVMSARSITKRWMLGSSPPVEAQTAMALGIPTRWLAASAGNDTIAVSRSASTWQVTVNNTPVVGSGDPTANLLVIDASQGQDQVTIVGAASLPIGADTAGGASTAGGSDIASGTGTAGGAGVSGAAVIGSGAGVELAHIQSGRIAVSKPGVPLSAALGYGVLIVGNAETRFIANLAREDRVVFDDSPAADTVAAVNNRIAMTYAMSAATAEAFNAGTQKIVSRAGTDRLTAESVDGVLEVVGQWM
jgi:hypothetical protein